MTDIQAKVWAGYAKAGAKLGQTYNHYRPSGVSNPTASARLLGTMLVAFDDKPNFKFQVPQLYGHPDFYALADGSLLQIGDYLIGNGTTAFIADMDRLLPITAIACNVTINVLRPAGPAGFGAQPYGGDAVASEVAVMTAWPASILQGTKGEKGDSQLVGDVRSPWFSVLLPAVSGTMIEAADVLHDNYSRRYKVSSAELSSFGWRLTAMLAET